MGAVLFVILGVVVPFVVMFSGVVTLVKSRGNETIKGMVVGTVVAVVGGLLLMIVSIILVHELTLYAPYFIKG